MPPTVMEKWLKTKEEGDTGQTWAPVAARVSAHRTDMCSCSSPGDTGQTRAAVAARVR